MAFQDSAYGVFARRHLSGKEKPLMIAGIALIAGLLFVAPLLWWGFIDGESFIITNNGSAEPNELPDKSDSTADAASRDSATSSQTTPAGESESSTTFDQADDQLGLPALTVHVAGCVQVPGVYALPTNARVSDAVNAAGGFSDNAAQDAINLARTLNDGEQVLVPSIEEARSFLQSSGETGNPQNQSLSPSSTKININLASESQLTALPGIGQATAAKIVADRQENGPFKSPEDLMRVSGIGEKKFESLRSLICVS